MPSKTKKTPLAEYARGTRKMTPGNWITTIPEWPEVLEAYQSGISQPTIRRWLIDECGYDPTECTSARLNWLSRAHQRRPRG